MRHFGHSLLLISVLLLVGCGDGDKSTKPVVPSDSLPAGTPPADSPPHLMQRLEATWESEVQSQYALLLDDDFWFQFSADTDPILVDYYGNTWRSSNEVVALTNLFDGFQSGGGQAIPGASRIAMSLTGITYGPDPDHPDSTDHYQEVVALLDADMEFPVDTEPIVYHLSSYQHFFLIRGDASSHAGEAGAATTWYLRRWEDHSSPLFANHPALNQAALPKTLGALKASFAGPAL